MKKSIYFPLTLLVAVTVAFSAYNFVLQPIAITDQDLKILVFGQEDLQYSVAVMRENTHRTIQSMQMLVEKQGNVPSDIDKLKQAEKIKEQAEEVYNLLYEARKNGEFGEMYEKTNSQYCGFEPPEIVEQNMNIIVNIGCKQMPNSKIKAMNINKLYQKIQAFQTLVKEKIGIVDSLTLSDLHKKPLSVEEFEDLNFNTNMIMALSNLSRIEANIAELESKAISHFEGKIGEVVIKFDNISAFISMEDDELIEGQALRAKMFIAATAKNMKPTMRVSQGDVVVDENGIGTVTFVVPKVADKDFDKNGLAKRKWQGAITIKKADGRDTTFKFDQEYFIKKD